MIDSEAIQITNSIKGEMEKWFLEQKVTELEKSSSELLSYISNSLTVAGLFFAVALFIAGWIMRIVLDDRLDSVKKYSEEAATFFSDIKETERKVYAKAEKIEEIEEEFKKSRYQWLELKEINEFLSKESNFYRQQLAEQKIITYLMLWVGIVEKKLEEISEEEIKAYNWEPGSDPPLDEFRWKQEPLLQAKEALESFTNHEYKLADYFSDIDEKEEGNRIDELEHYLYYLKEYYDFLSKFK